MERTEVDALLDRYGEESIPHLVRVDADAVPGATPTTMINRVSRDAALMRASQWVQPEHGSRCDDPGEVDLSIGSNGVVETVRGLSTTRERPFKDMAERPMDAKSWSTRRCRTLDAAREAALAEAVGLLRETLAEEERADKILSGLAEASLNPTAAGDRVGV